MTPSWRLTALLDACVLYPAPIRDLLLHIADEGLFTPKWTDRIQEEWTRNLLLNRTDLDAGQLRRATDAMNGAFPNATIQDYDPLIGSLTLPDPDDCHVLAAAIHGQVHVIVTANLNDFPSEYLNQFAVEAQHPDQFIAMLIALNPESVLNAFRAQVTKLRKPPRTAQEVSQLLRQTGLTTTADLLLRML